ncbi:MAG: hypothetical protein M3Q78_07330 [Acidobacteriota bacterium]|nr:hypothetical protein [Acidobacteriota bacterium]
MFKKIFGYLSTLILFSLIGTAAPQTFAQICTPPPEFDIVFHRFIF